MINLLIASCCTCTLICMISVSQFGISLLHCAAESGSAELVEWLMTAYPFDVEEMAVYPVWMFCTLCFIHNEKLSFHLLCNGFVLMLCIDWSWRNPYMLCSFIRTGWHVSPTAEAKSQPSSCKSHCTTSGTSVTPALTVFITLDTADVWWLDCIALFLLRWKHRDSQGTPQHRFRPNANCDDPLCELPHYAYVHTSYSVKHWFQVKCTSQSCSSSGLHGSIL